MIRYGYVDHEQAAEAEMTGLDTLEPQGLWKHFGRILEIPRPSKHEEKIRAYVLDVAGRLHLEHRVDTAGNLVVKKPAATGHEDAAITVLQAHLDMVNEKNLDTQHDFSTDPIRVERDGDYLTAVGTTLGADNGIGVAAMLAIMEAEDIRHGPLELLFTVDEETGLTGAAQLDGSMIEGRRLINLDTEEEGAIYVGCAGGGDSNLDLPLTWVPTPEGTDTVRLSLRGLKGGHSGAEIHLQRANAIRVLARIIEAAARDADFRLAGFRGGNMRNAIPREADALVVVPRAQAGAFGRRALAEFDDVRRAFAHADPDMALGTDDADPTDRVLDAESSWTVVHLLHALPHGVEAMSADIPGLVETSTNLAVARIEDHNLSVLTNTRSSVAGELTALRNRIRAIAHLAGADVEQGEPYPGWKPDLESPLLAVVRDVFAQDMGREPTVTAVHAGLETGIIGQKVPGMDMVSIGPQIEFPHSPDERVRIDSVGTFYRQLLAILEQLTR
jgi:dipeptidase D